MVIDDDPQAGHTEGVLAATPGRVPPLKRGPNELIRLSIDLPHNLALGDFQLCGHCEFGSARHPWRTPPGQLAGAKASQNDKLERVDCVWTMYHANHPLNGRNGGRFNRRA